MNCNKKIITENYNAFYMMTLSVAILGSYNSPEFDEDAKRLIGFIGRAFSLADNETEEMSGYILGDMMKIGLVTDYQAIPLSEDIDEDSSLLYEIKGRALNEALLSAEISKPASENPVIQKLDSLFKWEYFHHEYDSSLRFEEIKKRAQSGEINSTRQLALLYALGIGCEKSLSKSEMHLKRCVYWGDFSAAALLSQVYALMMDFEGVVTYLDVYNLMVDSFEKNIFYKRDTVSENANEIYLLSENVRREIISKQSKLKIDFNLTDILISDAFTREDKMYYILNIDNSSVRYNFLIQAKKNSIGFVSELK